MLSDPVAVEAVNITAIVVEIAPRPLAFVIHHVLLVLPLGVVHAARKVKCLLRIRFAELIACFVLSSFDVVHGRVHGVVVG